MASVFLDRVSNKALGELLVDKGALSESQVNEALDYSKTHAVRLGEALVALGYLTRDALGYAIGEQYGLKPMELHPSMIDLGLVRQFDFKLLSAHTMLPLILLDKELVVVVSDPNDQRGLMELSRICPECTITPQLGAADQIRRCLEAVRSQVQPASTTPDYEAPGAEASARELPRFHEVPQPDSTSFSEWLVGLAASHPGQDVLVRDFQGQLQVSLTPVAHAGDTSSVSLTEVGSWPGSSAARVRALLLQRSVTVEHTRGQAAQLTYNLRYNDTVYSFLLLLPIIQGSTQFFIRALANLSGEVSDDPLLTVPLSPTLEAGKYTVVLYDESASLEGSLSQFMVENSRSHNFVVSQQATRVVFPHAHSFPAPYANMVTAAQASAATCVIFDHPVEYREAIRLLTSTYPPPAILVCAPLPSYQGGAGSLSPDVEELISRQDAQSVRLMDARPGTTNNPAEGAN